MGEELDKPEKNYSPIDENNKYLKFGLNQVQGWKKTMEDYAIHFLDNGENKFMNIFGIFDGHGGREVPKYLSSHFLDVLNENKNFVAGKYKDAFSETFFELDKSFTTKEAQEELTKYSEEYKPDKEREIKEINDLCAPNEKLNNEELEQVMAFNEVFDPRNIENANIAEFTGATGIIIAVCYRDILVAHAGNSRCLILDQDGKILNKTKDHTMKDENEKKRVDLARSFNDEEEEKKKGEDEHVEYLDSTRGFGDLEFKGNEWIEQKDQEISVEPDILLVPYDKDNKQAKYIIFGSHGMFEGDDDKVNEEIGKFFIEEINKNKEKGEAKFSDIIKNYFEKIMAKEKNNDKNIGLDNMSCFLVELNLEEIKKYIEQKDEQIKEEKRKEEERKRKAKEEEMKRRAEEKKRREEERKRKEEEKKKKENGDKIGKEGEIPPKGETPPPVGEIKLEEKKEEIKKEKVDEPKEEKADEKKGEIVIEKDNIKDEKKEDIKEIKVEAVENPEEKKIEIKEEKKNEEGDKNEIVVEKKIEEGDKNEIVVEKKIEEGEKKIEEGDKKEIIIEKNIEIEPEKKVEEGEKNKIEIEVEKNIENEGEKKIEEGEKKIEEGEKKIEEGEKKIEIEGEKKIEIEGEKKIEIEGEKKIEIEGEKKIEVEGEKDKEEKKE